MYEALGYAADIALALDFLHDQNILHRDLKPSNILLDFSHNIYISDFGLARFISNTARELHTGHGTPPYAPPEQHAMKAMTKQSDIFSFGILLFEMFTGHLPWDGEKSLGMRQLYSQDELPDPRTLNPQLPADLGKILRWMTNADPASRPGSVVGALRELGAAFGIDPLTLHSDPSAGEFQNRAIDAQELLRRSLMSWESDGDIEALRLTHFAFINLEHKQAKAATIPMDMQRYMLHSALAFGLDDDYWWEQIDDVALKMDIASPLVAGGQDASAARVVGHLIHDERLTASKESLPGRMIKNLIETAGNANQASLRKQALRALRKLSPGPGEWRTTAFNDEADRALALLALEDTQEGDEAAQLIGQIRSITAANLIDQNADESRRIPALVEIQKAAGSLPASIPAKTRRTVSAKLMLGRVIDRPVSLLTVFLMAYLGSAISVGIQNYLIIRFPDYLDLVRISVSLERGLFLGAFFGMGILLIRLIVERFPRLKAPLRLTIATLTGGAIFSIGLLAYDILLANIDLYGLLFLAGCMLAAFGFAQGSLMRSGSLRMLVSRRSGLFSPGAYLGHPP